MKRITLLLGLALAGCSSASQDVAGPAAGPEEAAEPALPPLVDLVDPDPGYVGVVLPAVAVDVAPTYEGKIDSVNVAVGQRVEAGAAVATFDPAAAQEALTIARAEVRVAKGRAGEAAAAANHARHRLEIEQSLYQQGISAHDNVTQARADRAQAGAATASAAGEIAAAKARVEQLERQLQDMALAAPFSGTIAAVYREAGGLAGPGNPVVRIIKTDRSFVRFAVPTKDVANLALGSVVEVQLDWIDHPLLATVRDIAPEIDAPSGMIFVQAELAPEASAQAVPNSPVWVRTHAV